jgi:hypothetical protein
MKHLIAPLALILFLASYGDSIAKSPQISCVTNTNKASCEENTACQWAASKSKCKKVKASQASGTGKAAQPTKAKTAHPAKAKADGGPPPESGCNVHRSESYCENDTANKCHWDYKTIHCRAGGD